MSRGEPRNRPDRRSADERSLIVEPVDRGVGERAVIRVSDRDHHIAHEALPADALDRAAGEQRPERRLVETGELGERRGVEVGARREFRFPPGAGEFVPGADGQTVVAAVDAIADRRSKLTRDRTFVLDREIGDAAARVEPVGRGEGASSDRRRGRRGIGRNGRLPARRAAGRGRSRSRPGTATSRIRARPDWCACPASRGPAARPAASPSAARCRRTP